MIPVAKKPPLPPPYAPPPPPPYTSLYKKTATVTAVREAYETPLTMSPYRTKEDQKIALLSVMLARTGLCGESTDECASPKDPDLLIDELIDTNPKWDLSFLELFSKTEQKKILNLDVELPRVNKSAVVVDPDAETEDEDD